MKKLISLKLCAAMLLVCLSLLILVSCYTLDKEICPGDREVVVGSGMLIEDTRNVSYFDAVRM